MYEEKRLTAAMMPMRRKALRDGLGGVSNRIQSAMIWRALRVSSSSYHAKPARQCHWHCRRLGIRVHGNYVPVWLRIPIPIIATHTARRSTLARHREQGGDKVIQMTTSAQDMDSIPRERPLRIVDAEPVFVDATTSFTGGALVEVDV